MNDAGHTTPLSFEGKGGKTLAMYLARQNYKAALIGREVPARERTVDEARRRGLQPWHLDGKIVRLCKCEIK